MLTWRSLYRPWLKDIDRCVSRQLHTSSALMEARGNVILKLEEDKGTIRLVGSDQLGFEASDHVPSLSRAVVHGHAIHVLSFPVDIASNCTCRAQFAKPGDAE